MIREDFVEFSDLLQKLNELFEKTRSSVIGCGKYFKQVDRCCGYRYNWLNPKKFEMTVWLCEDCGKGKELTE